MFDPNASITERQRQEEFLKLKIQEGFALFTKDKKGFVDKREVKT
jgi:Ca2+-binding EF-hand superfamily protein